MSNGTKLATVTAAIAILVVAGMAFMLGDSGIGVGPPDTPSPSTAGADPTATPAEPSATMSSDAAGPVPGEFTASVPSNSEFRRGTDERVVVSHPDGDVTVERRRGFTWSGTIAATDERFSGIHYYGWDGDGYTLASGKPGPQVVAEGHRIENDEGAWQGWAMGAGLSKETRTNGPVFLTGEGAYEGLTAVLSTSVGTCFFKFTGLVMEVPEPPVPATSD